MPSRAPFYSVNEAKKDADKRVHHDHTECGPGGQIPVPDQRNGKGPGAEIYRQCDDCKEEHKKDAAKAAAEAARRLR